MKPFALVLLAGICFTCNAPTDHSAAVTSGPETESAKSVIAYYDDAWPQPDSVKYYFYQANGEPVSVEVAATPGDANELRMPANMLESYEHAANSNAQMAAPALIGHPFKLTYNAAGQVIKVEPAAETTGPAKLLTASYTKARVHEDHTEYSFLIEREGYSQFVSVRIDNDGADSAIDMPVGMLGDSPLAAPGQTVGAHPLLVDDRYLVYFDQKDQVYQVKSPDTNAYKLVEYESAAVYPDHTKFVFSIEDQPFFVNVGHEEEIYSKVEMPDNLLEDDTDLEGLPGENPALVGKIFKLYYDTENNSVFRIEAN